MTIKLSRLTTRTMTGNVVHGYTSKVNILHYPQLVGCIIMRWTSLGSINMRSQHDYYKKIIRFMEERNAYISPLKTREIADGCEMSVYLALYYLKKLNRHRMVEPDRSGKGSAICWHLVN